MITYSNMNQLKGEIFDATEMEIFLKKIYSNNEKLFELLLSGDGIKMEQRNYFTMLTEEVETYDHVFNKICSVFLVQKKSK